MRKKRHRTTQYIGKIGSFIVSFICIAVIIHKCAKKLWKLQNHSYDVILTVNGKDFHLKAFLDSGNHLSDPLTGKPVHIISQNACQKMASQISSGRLRYIPYQTIQKSDNILPVFSVQKMKITGESEFLIHSPMIGISEQKNFGNGKYEMLLHPKDC